MSIPNASKQQIDAMNKIAAEKMAQDGINHAENQVAQHEEVVQDQADQDTEVYQDADSHDAINLQELPNQDQEEKIEETVYASKQESNKESNLRVLRERAERAERERDEAMRYFMTMQQQQQPQKQQAPVQEEEDFSLNLDDESLVEGKHVKELAKQVVALKKMLKNSEQQARKTDQQTMEMRLQTQFPDFNKVVTQDNLVQLRAMNPDLADSILSNQDQYKQAKLAYEMVKQMGIYREEQYQQEKVIVQKNASKPRTLTSISPTQGDTPLSRANAFANGELTKDVKSNLYQEMLQAMKGL